MSNVKGRDLSATPSVIVLMSLHGFLAGCSPAEPRFPLSPTAATLQQCRGELQRPSWNTDPTLTRCLTLGVHPNLLGESPTAVGGSFRYGYKRSGGELANPSCANPTHGSGGSSVRPTRRTGRRSVFLFILLFSSRRKGERVSKKGGVPFSW